MLISEYLQMRNIAAAAGNVRSEYQQTADKTDVQEQPQSISFAEELQRQLLAGNKTPVKEVSAEELSEMSAVQFSKHAIERINERQIDIYSDDRLDRLNRAVELAEEKGSGNALVFIDSTAFLVSVKNNKVITTVTADDMQGNIFTNIDSTVVM